MAVVVHLTGDTKDLDAALASTSKKVQEVGDKAEKAGKSSGGFGSALGGVAKIAGGFALGGGLLQAPGFLLGAAQAAADDEQATARLEQTVRNLGGNYDELMKSVNDQIDAGQKLAFSDDEVRDSFQYLAQATNDSDEAIRRQKIAMDLSRGANISLDAASKMLGKTSEENINTLKKLGIEVADGASEADVLAGVQARFAGQSEAYAKSTAGQFSQAKLAMGEIVEGIGGAVLPILTTVGTTLAAHLPAIQAFVGEFAAGIGEVIIPAIQALIEFLGPVLAQAGEFFKTELLPRIQEFMEWLQPKLVELGDWIQEQFAKFSVYYESDIKPALENIRAGIEKVIAFVVEHWPEIEKVIRPVMDAVATLIETNVKVIMGVLGILIDLIGGDFSGAWERLQKLVDDVWTGIKAIIGDAIAVIKALAPIMLEAGEALGGALMDGLKKALGAVAGLAGDVATAVRNAVAGLINSQVIDRINSALQFDFDTHIPGVGTISINPDDIHHIPMLAKGGIVNSPTVALIGEAGPEAVIPLSSANAKGGSLLGIGLGEGPRSVGVSGGGSGRPTENLSLAELKSIKDHTAKAAKELENQEGFLAAMSKALHAGGTPVGDLIAQTAEALEVLPEIWKFLQQIANSTAQTAEALEVLPELWVFLRDMRDMMRNGSLTAFGNGAG